MKSPDKGPWCCPCQGYHKIESLLYRDGDVLGAGLYADELVRDSEDLVKAFQDASQFNASRTFDGIIDVATEIGAQLHQHHWQRNIESHESHVSSHTRLIGLIGKSAPEQRYMH